MAIYRSKLSSCWYVDIPIEGRRVRKSTGTDDRRKAQEYHDRLKTQLGEQQRIGVKVRHTWREAGNLESTPRG
jgi:hypothetical protein